MTDKDINLNKSFLVVGCGGLGCNLVEGLLRLGAKKITVCDPDVFSKSNLNRQLYSSPSNIGKLKVEAAKKRAGELGYSGEFTAIPKEFSKEMLDGIDVAIDALDNIKARLYLEDCCSEKNIPLVHGAVEGFVYQIGLSMPGSNLLHRIYENAKEPKEKHTNVITVSMCASEELALAIREPEEFFEMKEI